MGVKEALAELRITFAEAWPWMAPFQFAMMLWLWLASVYGPFQAAGVPYWLYATSGFLIVSGAFWALARANRRYIVPEAYKRYGGMMGLRPPQAEAHHGSHDEAEQSYGEAEAEREQRRVAFEAVTELP